MKRLKPYALFIPAIFLLSSCPNAKQQTQKDDSSTQEVADTNMNEIDLQLEQSANYLKNRDFDGDGINDYLSFSYSGGAHCCYKMSFKLSSKKDTLHYPFEMDGGYVFGTVDGSKPDQFSIEDCDGDGLPEILMRISTYNGEEQRIKKEWTNTYGIETNHIVFNFRNDRMVVRDNCVNLK